MGQRIDLQRDLESILGSGNVYFQPPESIKMQYPCIRYKLTTINDQAADNLGYIRYKQYTITVIDRDADSPIPERILEELDCRYSSFESCYSAEGLSHFILKIHY